MFEVISHGHSLAESPGFNAYSGVLFWVDIDSGSLSTWMPGGVVEKHDLRSLGVTSAHALSITKYLVTGSQSVYFFDVDGSIEVRWEGDSKDWRFNDSYLMVNGQLLLGTKSLTPGSPARLGIYSSGKLDWLMPELSLANGIAQDVRLGVTYIADSLIGTVWKTQSLSADDFTSPGMSLEPFISGIPGEPDGIVLDRLGNLLVAIWGLGQIRKYNPEGNLIGSLQLGTSHLTSLCWADAQQTSLLVTSADSGRAITSRFPMQGGDVILLEPQFELTQDRRASD